MTARIRIEAQGFDDGDVVIYTDAATAEQLANAWELAHSVPHGYSPTCHPLFLLEVGAMRRAAIDATKTARPSETTAVPHLRVVGGDPA